MKGLHLRSARFGIVDQADERRTAERFISGLQIRTPSPHTRVSNLSGGNQQKVVIGKWRATDTEILLFDEPTIGVDVGARLEIYNLMQALIDQGKAIIMVSSYLPEVIALSDRIMVMHAGRQMGIVRRADRARRLARPAAASRYAVGERGTVTLRLPFGRAGEHCAARCRLDLAATRPPLPSGPAIELIPGPAPASGRGVSRCAKLI